MLAMLLQGQTGATTIGTQSDKLGQLACTIRCDRPCTCLHVEGACKPAVPSHDSFLTMTPISLSPIVGLLHSISNIECILRNPLCCISSLSSIVSPKMDLEAKAAWRIAWHATSAQLPLPSTATGQAKHFKTLHPTLQNVLKAATVTNCLCWQVDG